MRCVERLVSIGDGELRIIAPRRSICRPSGFSDVIVSDQEYSRLLGQVQRFRGEVYLRDKAISAGDLDTNGRHVTTVDPKSWHLVLLDHQGVVQGCARYRAHPNLQEFEELDARHAALAGDLLWGRAMQRAIRYEHLENRRSMRDFFEVSGWAISEAARFSNAAMTVAMATYALGRVLGGGRGITTATTRHHSSRILRRLGGHALADGETTLPSYFDARYGCMMELLAFDTARPSPRYSAYVESFEKQLKSTPVVQCTAAQAPPFNSPASVELLGASAS